MKTIGIIAEYNPFHNGHLYQLEQSRKQAGAKYAVVVMSGDYTQRGTPAIYNKYRRALAALLSGADLVVELPVFGVVAGAADFADCGVSLLSQMGIADFLAFGSESGCLNALTAQQELLSRETEEVSLLVREGLKQGLTWPMARARALELSAAATAAETGEPQHSTAKTEAGVPVSPNDILGVEYLRALKKYSSPMEPLTIRRCDQGYHSLSLSGSFASATAIRRAITDQDQDFLSNVLPASFFESRKGEACPEITFDDFSALLCEKLLTSTLGELKAVSGMPGDLAGKLYRERLTFRAASELTAEFKDRQYTYTRVNRCLMNLILGVTEEETARFKELDSAPWIRILGFKKSSAGLLTSMKKNANAPIISKVADYPAVLDKPAQTLFEKHLRTSELYRMVSQLKTGQSMKNEFTRSVIIV